MSNIKLVFDIGGSSTKVGFVDEKHKIIKKEVINYEKPIIDWFVLRDKICDYIEKNKKDVSSIALSCPGAINFETGLVVGNSAIINLKNENPKTFLEKKFKLPVTIDNDANCAAIAELNIGFAKDVDNALMCVIGTGLGGAIIIDKKIYRGSNFFAGEYGSMYEADLPIALKNVSKSLKYKFTSFYGSFFAALNYKMITQKEKSCKDIYDIYSEDKIAKQVIDEMVFGVAKTLSNISLVLDPEVIIIGGAISENDLFLKLLEEQVDKFYELFNLDRKFKIKKTNFGNDANIIGASFLK